MPVINRFDSGVVIGVDKHYLDPTQSTVLVDANIEAYGVRSAKLPTDIGLADRSFYEFPIKESEPQEFHVTSSDRWRSYAEFQGRLVYSDGGPQCKVTDGDMVDSDFKWNEVGSKATAGKIVARPYLLSDIPGASAKLMVGAKPANGLINVSQIRYRLVDSHGTVFIGDIRNNTGNATVIFKLPAGVKVYRELVDEWGGHTDKFLFVGAGNFTDGLVAIDDAYEFIASTEIAEFSSHRISLVLGKPYSVPYRVLKSIGDAVLKVSEVFELTATDTWSKESIDIEIHHLNPPTDISAIASSFTFADKLYILTRIGNNYGVWEKDGTSVVNTTFPIDDEFFKCTTIENNGSLYFFSPSKGKALVFNGTTLALQTMPKFKYAKAEDSVFTIKGDTIYAILNDRHEANIRKIQLPALTVELTGLSRVKIEKVRGLGGSSGCNFQDGDFQVFPIHKGIISYSTLSGQVIEADVRGANVPTDAMFKGFTYFNTLIRAIAHRDDAKAILYKWNIIHAHAPTAIPVFDERTLSGTFLYNTSQETASGQHGPIMLTASNPISIHKGHMRVDLAGVTHTKDLRLYRTGGYLTEYKMVEDVKPTTVYTDKKDDVTIASHPTGVYNYRDAPPEGLMWLTEHKGRLFGSVGDTLYWSEPGDVDSWDRVKSFMILDRDITGIASAVFGLVIFMKGRIKLLSGNGPLDFNLSTVTNSKGTLDGRSIQSAREGVMFFSEDGLCFTDGRQVVEFSYKLLGSRTWNVIDSTTTDRSYFALCENFMEGTLNPARVIMRVDLEEAPKFSFLEADNVSGLGYVNGKLAHTKGDNLLDTLGSGERIFNYKSGNISEGIITMVKEWNRVRLSGEFIGIFIVRIDDREVIVEDVLVGINDELNFHIPKDRNKGKSISFEAIGTGLITTIEYSITPRSTTK